MVAREFHPRRALTLIEVMVVFVIVGILFALLLCAVVRVRDLAYQVQSKNNLKQIVLALHSYAEAERGALPLVPTSEVIGNVIYPMPNVRPFFVKLLPYLEEGNRIGNAGPVAIFLSPADPTAFQGAAQRLPLASYCANAQVFLNNPDHPRLPGRFRDGLSNTIALAEHYARCNDVYFEFTTNHITAGLHRASFADVNDVRPVTIGNPPVSGPISNDDFTFQPAPDTASCDWALAQTPHASGMLAALGDGSVRIISPGISTATYWGAVTPRSGEILGNDW